MRNKIYWIPLIVSTCIAVSFVLIVSILSHRGIKKEIPVAEEITDEILSRQSQELHQDIEPLRSKADDNEIATQRSETEVDSPTHEGASPEPAIQSTSEEPSELGDLEGEFLDDEEFVEWYKRERLPQYLEQLQKRVEENIAEIEPLFKVMDFYGPQLEPLKRQQKWIEYSQASAKYRGARRRAYAISTFLRKGPAPRQFGHLYLSTPEYAKLEAFVESLGWR